MQEIDELQYKDHCNPAHSSNIEFVCWKEHILCCTECAASHLEHSEYLESIKSIYTRKLSEYQKLKDITKILYKKQCSFDESRSRIYQNLENAFDQMITLVMNMKSSWIGEHFKQITKGFEGEGALELRDIQLEIKEAIREIKGYMDGVPNINTNMNISTNTNSNSLFKLRSPQILDRKIKESAGCIYKNNVHDVDININFDADIIKKMFNIKKVANKYTEYTEPPMNNNTISLIPNNNIISLIPNNNKINLFKRISSVPMLLYSGSLLNYTDLNYIKSLFYPMEIRELKLLYCVRKDGPLGRTFHSQCDGISDTLVLVKGNRHIFGGFAKPKWNSKGRFIPDISLQSFLFTCRNHTKHTLNEYKYAINGCLNIGPTFGCNCSDLYITGDGRRVHTNIGNSYSIPKGTNKEHFMSGSGKLGVTLEDYEVHKVIFL